MSYRITTAARRHHCLSRELEPRGLEVVVIVVGGATKGYGVAEDEIKGSDPGV